MTLYIRAFEVTLISPNAPFDHFQCFDTEALTAREKIGFQLK